MSRLCLVAALMALVFTASGCATTGDPTAGGLFGWSEKKAIQRQDEAYAALDREERIASSHQAERQRLQAQINAKKKQLGALKKKQSASPKPNTSSGPSSAQADAAAEMARLQREIDQLTRDSLALSEF